MRYRPMLLLSICAMGVVAGCGKPLLSPREERTQYDRYDRVRNNYSQQYVEDEFGVERPNLRERLRPR